MVIILDEKQMLPAPPPYESERAAAPPFPGGESSAAARPPATFGALPPHVLLAIVHQTMNPRKGKADIEYKRKVLYWMTVCLRLVNRSVYIACMHVLRSTYLPAYSSMIKAPYTSDPFPLSTSGSTILIASSSSTMAAPVNSIQRETQVLDLFLAAKVREDVWSDESELHLEREEAFMDLFAVLQPKARLEDLVRAYGTAAGVISVSTTSGNAVVATTPCSTPSPSSTTFPSSVSRARGLGRTTRRVPFSSLSCSFGPRSAGIVLTTKSTRRTIVEVVRAKDEKLEVAAKRLVRQLETWVAENNSA